jgi:hypothetical protein
MTIEKENLPLSKNLRIDFLEMKIKVSELSKEDLEYLKTLKHYKMELWEVLEQHESSKCPFMKLVNPLYSNSNGFNMKNLTNLSNSFTRPTMIEFKNKKTIYGLNFCPICGMKLLDCAECNEKETLIEDNLDEKKYLKITPNDYPCLLKTIRFELEYQPDFIIASNNEYLLSATDNKMKFLKKQLIELIDLSVDRYMIQKIKTTPDLTKAIENLKEIIDVTKRPYKDHWLEVP